MHTAGGQIYSQNLSRSESILRYCTAYVLNINILIILRNTISFAVGTLKNADVTRITIIIYNAVCSKF